MRAWVIQSMGDTSSIAWIFDPLKNVKLNIGIIIIVVMNNYNITLFMCHYGTDYVTTLALQGYINYYTTILSTHTSYCLQAISTMHVCFASKGGLNIYLYVSLNRPTGNSHQSHALNGLTIFTS